jgi:hypothetical protein
MDVIVDSNRIFSLDSDPSDLISAVAAITELLKARGRTIVSLKADGQEVAPEDLSTLGKRSTADVATLEVSSADIASLVDQNLKELDEVLPELPKACHALAAVFQGDSPSEGFEPFRQLAEIWSEVKSRELQIAGLCDCAIEETVIGGIPVRRLHDELNRYLEEAAGALESGDCVLLGDLLEYELAPRAEAEAQIVAALRQRVEALAGGQ